MGRVILLGSESLKYGEKELVYNIRNLICRCCRKDEEISGKEVFATSTVKNDNKDFDVL